MRSEQITRNNLKTDAGVWIEQLITATPRPEGEGLPGQEAPAATGMPGMPFMGGMDPAAAAAFRRRYGLEGGGRGAMPFAPPQAAEPTPSPEGAGAEGAGGTSSKHKGDTNEVATLTITFRAVSLREVSGKPDADSGIAFTVLQELQQSPLIDPDPQETHVTSEVNNDEQTKTFTFSLVARLKRPLKL